jgi:hypothetical protein
VLSWAKEKVILSSGLNWDSNKPPLDPAGYLKGMIIFN